MSLITIGLAEIMVGVAAPTGTMPTPMAKIGKTYKDSCKMVQAASDVTEHYEEGKAAPEVRKKTRKMPVLTFGMMDPDVTALVAYVGGSAVDTTKWGFDGTEVVSNVSIRIEATQGLWFDIPNADIEAVINADFSAKGIFLVDFTVTPLSVTAGKPLLAYPKPA